MQDSREQLHELRIYNNNFIPFFTSYNQFMYNVKNMAQPPDEPAGMAENGGWFREYSDGTNKRRYLLAEPGFCFVMLYPFHSTCAFPEPGIEPGTCDFRVRRASHSAAIRRPVLLD